VLSKLVSLIQLTFLLLPLVSNAAIDVVVNSELTRYVVGEGIEYFEDPNHEYTVDTIMEGGAPWLISNQSIFNKGYTDSTWWLKIGFKNGNFENE